jgi:hypothetical protein
LGSPRAACLWSRAVPRLGRAGLIPVRPFHFRQIGPRHDPQFSVMSGSASALTRSLLSMPKRTALLLHWPRAGVGASQKGILRLAVSVPQHPVKDTVPLPDLFARRHIPMTVAGTGGASASAASRSSPRCAGSGSPPRSGRHVGRPSRTRRGAGKRWSPAPPGRDAPAACPRATLARHDRTAASSRQ